MRSQARPIGSCSENLALLLVFSLALSLFLPACSSDGAGRSRDREPPAVEIDFPPPISLTNGLQVTVRGKAADRAGVAAIGVNGDPAETADGFAAWEATVALAPGKNEIVVEAEDLLGNGTVQAARVEVESSVFPVDPSAVAVVEEGTGRRAFVIDLASKAVMGVNLATGERTVVSGPAQGAGPSLDWPAGIAAGPSAGRLLVADRDLAALLDVDLATGDRRIVSDVTVGRGDGLSQPVDVALDARNRRAIVLDEGLDAIVAVDLDTGDRTVVSSATLGTGQRFPDGSCCLEVDAGVNRAYLVSSGTYPPGSDRLIVVDLATGDRTLLPGETWTNGPFEGPVDIALDEPRNRVLAVDIDGRHPWLHKLLAVDLSTGETTRLFSGDSWSGDGFRSPTGLAFDAASGRALVTDIGLHGVYAFDLAASALTILSRTSIGLGPLLNEPRHLAQDTRRNRLLVSGGSIGEVLAADLGSGSRSVLSGSAAGAGPAIESPNGLAIDPKGDRALASGTLFENPYLAALFALDPVSGDRKVLSILPDVGAAFPLAVGAQAVDGARNRVLLHDGHAGELLAIDLQDGRHVVSSGPSVGSGPSLLDDRGGRRGVAVDPAGDRAFVFVRSVGGEALVAVDLETGNRTAVSASNPGSGSGPWPEQTAPVSLGFDPARDRALYSDSASNSILAIDLATGEHEILSGSGVGRGPLFLPGIGGIAVDPARGVLFVTDANLFDVGAIYAVDLVNGDRVVVSM